MRDLNPPSFSARVEKSQADNGVVLGKAYFLQPVFPLYQPRRGNPRDQTQAW